MPELTTAQIQEMQDNRRALSEAGRAMDAHTILVAIQEGRYKTIDVVEKVEEIEPPKLNAGKEKWAEFALAHSDIDEAVVEMATRDDIIEMLRANGIIERPAPVPAPEEGE